jgi:hypothetical protein
MQGGLSQPHPQSPTNATTSNRRGICKSSLEGGFSLEAAERGGDDEVAMQGKILEESQNSTLVQSEGTTKQKKELSETELATELLLETEK